ncbi:MAG: exosome complex RNA-binding protein Rrp4 [Fervidicoccaceae archaeon]
MSEIPRPVFYIQQRDIVLPGDLIAEGKIETNSVYLYKEGNKYYSSIIGLAEIKEDKVYLIPMEHAYIPKPNDMVVGLITDVGPTYWTVDINSPYEGQLPVGETLLRQTQATVDTLRKFLSIGDHVLLRVLAFDRLRDPVLTMRGKGLGKITQGKVIELSSRVANLLLFRKRTLVELIAKETETSIFVGNNGRIWLYGKDPILEDIAILALKKIDSSDISVIGISNILEFIREEKARRGDRK